jgi:hypothetical protein
VAEPASPALLIPRHFYFFILYFFISIFVVAEPASAALLIPRQRLGG